MCRIVVFKSPANEYIQDAGTLSKKLGVPIVLVASASFEPDPEGCLCSVDIDAMARNAGRTCKDVRQDWDEWDWIDYVIDPIDE